MKINNGGTSKHLLNGYFCKGGAQATCLRITWGVCVEMQIPGPLPRLMESEWLAVDPLMFVAPR